MRCISEGEERKEYESGDKASVIRSVANTILGTMPFRNEYDGHAIEPSSEQAGRLSGRKTEVVASDREYRGKEGISGTKIVIPDVHGKSDSRHQRLKIHKLFRKHAGIEASTGHLKSDYRLVRNFLKVQREML